MSTPRLARAHTHGFTVVELVVSLAIFSMVGYTLSVALDAGKRSEEKIHTIASEDEALRTATRLVLDELGTSADTKINVTVLGDGNHQVRFQMPITVGGNSAWGVYDRALGATAAQQNQAGWSIQYTVRNATLAGGKATKELVRQELDVNQVVQREKVIVRGLRSGAAVPPGFQVVKVGSMWQVTLYLEGALSGKPGLGAVFHVQARNT